MATSKIRMVGLESILIGACGADGTMGGSLTPLGHFVEESALLSFPLPTKTEIIDEESDEPDMILKNRGGAKTLAFSTRDMSNANLILAFGGAENASSGWDAPTDVHDIERSVKIKSKVYNGTRRVYYIPRASISAAFNGKFNKKDPGTIDFEVDVITPRDAGDVALAPVYINPENISGKVIDPIITQSAVDKFTITCATGGSAMKYSITGLDPTGAYGTAYSAEVTITEEVLVRAVGTLAENDNSNIVSKIITYTAA